MKNILNKDTSGKNKIFETESDLMNYWHDRCMPGESKMFEIDRLNELLTMKGACQVKVKYLKRRQD